MYLELDGNGPYYGQITRALKGAMLAGRVPAGDRLPPSRALARELGVSRNTVVAAYEQLQAEGYLTGRVGSGSYVAALKAVRPSRAKAGATAAPVVSRYAKRARKLADSRFSPTTTNSPLRWNLQYGAPFTNARLTTAWSRELAKAARRVSPDYAVTPGLPALREAICDYLARRRGVHATPDDILVVNGTQQALELCVRVLVDEGDPVAIEDPAYFGARHLLNAHGARIVPVPVDDDGLVTDALPDETPRFVFTSPSHQFPSGATLSLDRRLALIDYAIRHRTYVVEDDYDGEFRYDARPLAALRSLDTSDRVIYVGTFSKVMFPGLRLGYLVLPAALREDFLAAKWMSDFSSAAVEQGALASFMRSGGFERHIRSAARTLKERRSVLMQALADIGHGRIEVRGANAGMHLVAWLPGFTETQIASLMQRARERGVGVYSIARHYLRSPPAQGLLLGYAGVSASELAAGMRVFGQVFDLFRTKRG